MSLNYWFWKIDYEDIKAKNITNYNWQMANQVNNQSFDPNKKALATLDTIHKWT